MCVCVCVCVCVCDVWKCVRCVEVCEVQVRFVCVCRDPTKNNDKTFCGDETKREAGGAGSQICFFIDDLIKLFLGPTNTHIHNLTLYIITSCSSPPSSTPTCEILLRLLPKRPRFVSRELRCARSALRSM